MVQGKFCDVCKNLQRKNKSEMKNLRIYEFNRVLLLNIDVCKHCQDNLFKYLARKRVDILIEDKQVV